MNRILLTAMIVGSLGLAGAAQAAGDPAAGKVESKTCVMCHGHNGKGTNVAPKLAGLAPAVFVQALENFKSGKTVNAMMKAQADKLNPEQMANLAAYYASLK